MTDTPPPMAWQPAPDDRANPEWWANQAARMIRDVRHNRYTADPLALFMAAVLDAGRADALNHGDPTPPPENAYPTPAQFVWRYLHEPYERQLSRAKVILELSEKAYECRTLDHAGAMLNNHIAEGLVNHYRNALAEIATRSNPTGTSPEQAIARKALGQPEQETPR